MKHGAQPDAKIATPPSSDIVWRFEVVISQKPEVRRGKCVHVRARSWFEARVEAMRLLGVGPDSLRMVPIP